MVDLRNIVEDKSAPDDERFSIVVMGKTLKCRDKFALLNMAETVIETEKQNVLIKSKYNSALVKLYELGLEVEGSGAKVARKLLLSLDGRIAFSLNELRLFDEFNLKTALDAIVGNPRNANPDRVVGIKKMKDILNIYLTEDCKGAKDE